FGFDASELARARASVLRMVDADVEGESTRPSSSWVSEILDSAQNQVVPADASVKRDTIRPILVGTDPASCRQAFAKAWNDGVLIICVSGPIDLQPNPANEIEEVYRRCHSEPISGRSIVTPSTFAYASDPSQLGT